MDGLVTGDSRHDDATEALPDFELVDQTESGEFFTRTSTGITVIKVLFSLAGQDGSRPRIDY